MKNDTRALGRQGENEALKYLTNLRYKLLKRNYRAERCEIDLVMLDGETVVFIEVKARATTRYGLGREAVNKLKQQNILRAARHYLKENTLFDAPVRFDVLEVLLPSVQIEHIKNAFGE